MTISDTTGGLLFTMSYNQRSVVVALWPRGRHQLGPIRSTLKAAQGIKVEFHHGGLQGVQFTRSQKSTLGILPINLKFSSFLVNYGHDRIGFISVFVLYIGVFE